MQAGSENDARRRGAAFEGVEPTDPFDGQWYINVSGKTHGPYAGHDVRQMIERGRIKASDFVYSDQAPQWIQTKDDPILGVLFQTRASDRPVPERPVAIPRRQVLPTAPGDGTTHTYRGRGIKIGFGVSVLVVLFWIVWPYYALYDLSIALRNGDTLALEGQVAWGSVREGLRGDLTAIFLQKLRSEKPDLGTGLAVLLGPAVINQIVDGYVTPQAISTLIRTGRPTAVGRSGASGAPNFNPDEVARLLDGKSSSTTGQSIASAGTAQVSSKTQDAQTNQFNLNQVKYAFFSGGPFTFKVEIAPPAESGLAGTLTLLWKWSGDWKLTRIFLPADAFDAADNPLGDVPAGDAANMAAAKHEMAQQDNLMWPASDDQGLLSDLLGIGFKLPELVLMTIKPEAWPLQECAAANFKQQPTMTWDAKGLTDEADHDLLIQKVSPIFILCAAHAKSWAESCRKHYQPNICAMLTVYLVSVQNHCVRSYGRACTANETLKALQDAGNPPPESKQTAGAPAPSPTTTESADQTIRAHCQSQWADDFRMRAYCERQQREAMQVLAMGKPGDISQEEFGSVRGRCASEWPDDFNMRAYCEKQQFEAIRELRHH